MKKYFSIATVGVVAVLAIWWFTGDAGGRKNIALDSTQRYAPVSSSQMGPDRDSRAKPPSGDARSASYYLTSRNEPGFRRFSPETPLDLPPPDFTKRNPTSLDAVTPEEAVWLDQHGYPTIEEVEALSKTSELELAERAAEGDVTALGLLGEKQLQREETIVAGYENLSEAALQGSIWAIIAMARHQSAYGNQNDAFALYNLAALRGDWLSPSVYMTTMPQQLLQREYKSVPGRTAQYFSKIQGLRNERGMLPLQNRMRPNQFNRPETLDRDVGIYRRSR